MGRSATGYNLVIIEANLTQSPLQLFAYTITFAIVCPNKFVCQAMVVATEKIIILSDFLDSWMDGINYDKELQKKRLQSLNL